MKFFIRYNLVILILFFSLKLGAQGTNCSNADPFCTGTTYNFPNSVNVPNAGQIGCLASTPNPAWYYMEIDQSGTLQITISQSNGSGSALDVDFALWGPFNTTNAACSAIGAGSPPIQSSYDDAAIETVGIGMPGGSNDFCATGSGGATTPPSAVSGQVYMLLLTNFSNNSGNITFSQTGGTGSTDCNIVIPCDITTITANPTPCSVATNTYNLSGTISFTDPPTAGTLTVTNSCGGGQQIFNAPFVSPIAYSFNSLFSNGIGCTVTASFSDSPNCTGTGNYQAPASCVPCDLVIDNVVVDSASCNGTCDGSITITASGSQGPFVYSVNNGATTQASPVFNNLCSGAYTVWVQDAGGISGVCNVTQVVTIHQPSTVTLTQTETDTDCGTCLGEIDINASGGTGAYQYSIDNGATFQSSDIFNQLCIGTYTILVEDANNCQSSINGIIEPLNGPDITQIIANPTFCPTSCDGEIIINAINGALYSIDGGTTFQASNTFNNLCAGTYYIVVSDGLGCEDNGQATIVNPPPIPVSFYFDPPRPTIFNTNVNFYNTTAGFYDVVWTFDTLGTASTPYSSFDFPAVPGTYEICLELTDPNGCSNELCQYITVYDEPAFFVPNAFTPNGDGKNDVFSISVTGIDPSTFEFLIFNRWGNLIFQTNDLKFEWNGTTTNGPNTEKSQIDVYVYRVRGIAYSTQELFEKRGHITVIR